MLVLAPAGSLESFYCAIFNGADEIYMGINAFNARGKADNISNDDIRKAIVDAHLLGVKVYCTLNTLIYENELKDVCGVIQTAINMGFDAFIVQDLAVLQLIKKIDNNAVIHLSTQMGIHNSYGAKIAKKLGASRIVLSREASIDDIRAIHNAVPEMEIEYFVQGALCVAFSGNCYLSNRLLNKSGNRGQCAQLCRLPYTAEFRGELKEKAYYLSPADLCLVSHLQELKNAGVTSLKIEGRLRRASYVGQATSFYCKAVDFVNQKSENVNENDLNNLKITYNRGNYLQNAYINTNTEKIIYKEIQNHIGLKIGTVLSCEKFKNIFKIALKLNYEIGKGDGLKIIRNNKEITSLGVGNAEKAKGFTIIYSTQKLTKDDEVHLIHSQSLENALLNNRVTCPLEFEVFLKENERAKIVAKLPQFDKIFEFESDFIVQKALNNPVSHNDITESLSKLNDKIFSLQNVKIEANGIFIPKSELNSLRRNILEKIRNGFSAKQIEVKNPDNVVQSVINDLKGQTINSNYNEKEFVSLKLNRELNEKSAFFPNEYLSSDFTNQCEKYLQTTKANLNLFLPPFVNDKDLTSLLAKLKGLNEKYNGRIVLIAGNISQMELCGDFTVYAGEFCNIINSISALTFLALGATKIALGYEIENKAKYANKYFNLDVADNNILCFLSHCPYKAVTNTNCNKCAFDNSLIYKGDNKATMQIGRYKFSRCYFFLTIAKS